MKKILCFLFAIFLVFACFPSAQMQAKADTPSSSLKCEACLSDNDNIKGLGFSGSNGTSLFAQMMGVAIRYGNGGCWFCPLFKAGFRVINNIATKLYKQLQDKFLMLLALGGVLWVCWMVFQFEITLHGANVGEFWTNLVKALGKMMFAAWFLWQPASFVFGIIVDPVVLIATSISQEVMSASSMNPMTMFTVEYNCPSCSDDRLDEARVHPEVYLCNYTSADNDMFYDYVYDEDGNKVRDENNELMRERKALSPEIYNSFMCYLKTVSITLIVGMVAGQVMATWGLGARDGILPFTFTAMLVGSIVTLAYFLYFLFVPLKFIDLLVRLGFVFILLPFFIVCWVFPVTKQYAKKGWDMLISCLFTLLCLTVFIVIGLELVEGAVR